MNKTTATCILEKTANRFWSFFDVSDSDARLLCVSVLCLWALGTGGKPRCSRGRTSTAFTSAQWIIYPIVDMPKISGSQDWLLTHYKGQEATTGRHLNRWRALFCTSNLAVNYALTQSWNRHIKLGANCVLKSASSHYLLGFNDEGYDVFNELRYKWRKVRGQHLQKSTVGHLQWHLHNSLNTQSSVFLRSEGIIWPE